MFSLIAGMLVLYFLCHKEEDQTGEVSVVGYDDNDPGVDLDVPTRD